MAPWWQRPCTWEWISAESAPFEGKRPRITGAFFLRTGCCLPDGCRWYRQRRRFERGSAWRRRQHGWAARGEGGQGGSGVGRGLSGLFRRGCRGFGQGQGGWRRHIQAGRRYRRGTWQWRRDRGRANRLNGRGSRGVRFGGHLRGGRRHAERAWRGRFGSDGQGPRARIGRRGYRLGGRGGLPCWQGRGFLFLGVTVLAHEAGAAAAARKPCRHDGQADDPRPHVHATPPEGTEFPCLDGKVGPNGGADIPMPVWKQGGLCHSVQR